MWFVCLLGFVYFILFLCLLPIFIFSFSKVFLPVFRFQIAYRIASDKFKGKLSELFLVLSDSYTPPPDDDGFQANRPRGQKHRLEDDRMSVESDSKRPDVTTSAEKNQGNKAKNKPKAKANK